jgi:hypothetical protein
LASQVLRLEGRIADMALETEEEYVLRMFGTPIIQAETRAFDNASAVGELLDAS